MSVMDEINRIKGAKEDLKSSIEGKGVSVLSSELIDEYANHVDEIAQTGAVSSVNGQTGDVVLDAADVGAGTYSKPSDGIPSSDLASAVQTSLGKADTAVQPSAIASMQTTGNLVTSVSAQSTDSQYPSAKCLYDLVGNIESLLASI